MSLADQVIAANEEEEFRREHGLDTPDKKQEYYTDDLGFLVEKDIKRNPERYTEYLEFRCRYLNPYLYQEEGNLFNYHTLVEPKVPDISLLAKTPSGITVGMARIIHHNLLQDARYLDRTKLYLFDGYIWDLKQAKIIREEELKGDYIILGKGGNKPNVFLQGHTTINRTSDNSSFRYPRGGFSHLFPPRSH